MNKLIIPIIIILILAAGIGLYLILQKPAIEEITNFKECAKAGYPILETHPRQCKTPDGRKFTEILEPRITCTRQGGTICSSSQICSGSLLSASDTDKCCDEECGILINATETCSELGGYVCSSSQTCSGEWLYASDTGRCCSEECEILINATETCSELNGHACFPDETCSGEWLIASDTEKCCDGECGIPNGGLPDVPYVFFNLHTNPGEENDKNFAVLEDLINLADSYNTKQTLGLQIQWIDMILADPVKTEKVRQWQENGHEIAIEHHGPTHAGWDGYSNLPEETAIEVYKKFYGDRFPSYLNQADPYLGTFDEAYARFNQLAYPNTVKSGVTPPQDYDTVDGLIYELDSLKVAPWAEGRTSKVVVNIFNNHEVYRLNVRSGYLDDDWKTNMEECKLASPNEICGFIAHLGDYAKDDFATAKEVWSYYYEKDPEGKKRKSVTWIMENYVIPNDLIIYERCGNTICDGDEFETGSCPSDCKLCNKKRFGDYWINIHSGSIYNCDVGNSSQIYLMGKAE